MPRARYRRTFCDEGRIRRHNFAERAAASCQLAIRCLHPDRSATRAVKRCRSLAFVCASGLHTPGIYVKTVLFTVSDQARDSPPGWPQDPEGFAKRVGTRYAQFLMQNSFTAVAMRCPVGSHVTTFAAIARALASASSTRSSATS